jgi:hypothetical protein
MEFEEAFRRLGLALTATEAEIQDAYRGESKAAHPDAGGGSEEAMKELNAAKDIALGVARDRSLIVIATAVTGPLTAQLDRAEHRAAARDLVRGIVAIHVGRVKAYRAWAAILAAVSGAVTLVTSGIVQAPAAFALSSVPVAAVASASVVLFGLMAAMLNGSANGLEQSIEAISAELQNRGVYADLIAEIGMDPGSRFSLHELEEAVGRWAGSQHRPSALALIPRTSTTARRLARVIGPYDMTRLLIESGTSTAMLREVDVLDDEGYRLVYEYSPARAR